MKLGLIVRAVPEASIGAFLVIFCAQSAPVDSDSIGNVNWPVFWLFLLVDEKNTTRRCRSR